MTAPDHDTTPPLAPTPPVDENAGDEAPYWTAGRVIGAVVVTLILIAAGAGVGWKLSQPPPPVTERVRTTEMPGVQPTMPQRPAAPDADDDE